MLSFIVSVSKGDSEGGSVNSKQSIGIGIVGAGSVSEVHAEAVHQLDGARLASVYSRNRDNARQLAEKYETAFTADWEEFLKDDRVDAVSVCTPSGAHLEYSQSAAEAGKHVIVEKPIEVSLEKARRLIDACRQHHVHLSVIFQNRFIPDVRKMRDAIRSGVIGDVHLADAYIKWFRDQEYYDTGGWRGTLELDGGGALINQSIHTIDLLQWMVGDVEEIYGQVGTFTHRMEGEDTGVAVLRFANGALGVVEGATSVSPAQERRLEIHGTKGTAVLKGNRFALLTGEEQNQNEGESEGAGAASPFAGFSVEPHKQQYADILQAIREGRESSVPGEEALKSLGIIQGIYSASRKQQPVNLSDLLT